MSTPNYNNFKIRDVNPNYKLQNKKKPNECATSANGDALCAFSYICCAWYDSRDMAYRDEPFEFH